MVTSAKSHYNLDDNPPYSFHVQIFMLIALTFLSDFHDLVMAYFIVFYEQYDRFRLQSTHLIGSSLL